MIKWLLQAISCGKLGTLSQPGLKKFFFLQRRNPRGWSSEVNQQFDGFYCAQVLRGSGSRFWIFLFEISNINNKSCPGWPGLTPQRVIHTPENPRFVSSCCGRFKIFFFKVEFFNVFNSQLPFKYFLDNFKWFFNNKISIFDFWKPFLTSIMDYLDVLLTRKTLGCEQKVWNLNNWS